MLDFGTIIMYNVFGENWISGVSGPLSKHRKSL